MHARYLLISFHIIVFLYCFFRNFHPAQIKLFFFAFKACIYIADSSSFSPVHDALCKSPWFHSIHICIDALPRTSGSLFRYRSQAFARNWKRWRGTATVQNPFLRGPVVLTTHLYRSDWIFNARKHHRDILTSIVYLYHFVSLFFVFFFTQLK